MRPRVGDQRHGLLMRRSPFLSAGAHDDRAPRQSLSRLLGPVPPRRARARLAARRLRPLRARSSRSPAAAWCRRRSSRANSTSASSRRSASPPTTTTRSQGGLEVLKTIAPEIARLDEGAKVLIVDDLVDTGATAKMVREMLPKRPFRHRLRQAARPADGRHLHHRSVAGHLDLLPLGHGPRLPAADRRGRGVRASHRVRFGFGPSDLSCPRKRASRG